MSDNAAGTPYEELRRRARRSAEVGRGAVARPEVLESLLNRIADLELENEELAHALARIEEAKER